MRSLISRERSERGATAVTFAFLAIPLLAGVGLAVDVGAVYFEKAQLQNGADAAALAVALACAEDASQCVVDSTGHDDAASSFANVNANDNASGISVVFREDRREVTVFTDTLTSEGNGSLAHPFAALVGVDSTSVAASATAEWGGVLSGTTLALAIDECEFEQFGPEAVDPATGEPVLTAGTAVLLRYDETTQKSPGCSDSRGGFGWLESAAQNCLIEMEIDNSTGLIEGVLDGTTGNNSKKSGCTSTLLDGYVQSGESVLVPIFYDVDGAGSGTEYRVKYFASVKILDYKISGNDKIEGPSGGGGNGGGGNGGGGNGGGGNGGGGNGGGGNGGGSNDLCSGNCRGIYVEFVEWVSVSDLDVTLGGSGPNGSAEAVRLIAAPRP